MVRLLLFLLGSVLFAPFAFADAADVVNSVRASGCGRYHPNPAPLRVQRNLSAATRRLARGDSLEKALVSGGYRARHSASLRIAGNIRDDVIAKMIRANFCEEIMEPTFRDIGIYEGGNDLWMIIAEPLATPALKDAATVSQRVLELTNAARARGGRCGATPFAPAPPLRLDSVLEKAALEHSKDMAEHSTLTHEGSDGTTPAERAARAGYPWRIVGENVASGPSTADEVMNGWLASPHHCSNIMDSRFRDMAVEFYVDRKSASVIYWTQMFGLPR